MLSSPLFAVHQTSRLSCCFVCRYYGSRKAWAASGLAAERTEKRAVYREVLTQIQEQELQDHKELVLLLHSHCAYDVTPVVPQLIILVADTGTETAAGGGKKEPCGKCACCRCRESGSGGGQNEEAAPAAAR